VGKQDQRGRSILDLRASNHCSILGTPRRKDLLVKKNLLKYSLVALVIALGTCTAAYGMIFSKKPEIDPSLAVRALTLLAGSLAVLRVRRKK
jgi:hypothetical protein